MAETEAERNRDLDRFLTFLDAVVAIAITLLVLPLVELAGEAGGGTGSVAHLLHEHDAEIGAFLLSFAVISRLWFVQHRALRNVVAYDDRIAGLLALWMLFIVFLPFPTALVAETAGDALTKILYIGTMILATIVLCLVEELLVRHPELSDGGGLPDPVTGWSSVALLTVALAITLLVPVTSFFPLFLLLLADGIARRWRRLRRGGPDTTGVGG